VQDHPPGGVERPVGREKIVGGGGGGGGVGGCGEVVVGGRLAGWGGVEMAVVRA